MGSVLIYARGHSLVSAGVIVSVLVVDFKSKV
jgi:hypothetical protein